MEEYQPDLQDMEANCSLVQSRIVLPGWLKFFGFPFCIWSQQKFWGNNWSGDPIHNFNKKL